MLFAEVCKISERVPSVGNQFIHYQPNKLVTFVTNSCPMHVEASYLFEAASKGTRVTCKLEMNPRGRRLAGVLVQPRDAADKAVSA